MSNKRKIFDYSNTNYGINTLDSTLSSANGNVAFGTTSLVNNTSGNDNTGIGFQSLINNTIGSRNTTLGSGSGNGIISGNGNVIIGYNAGSNIPSNSTDTLLISNSSTNNLILGNFSTQKIGFCYGNGSITGALTGDISIDGQQDRLITLDQHLTSHGKSLTLSAGNGGGNNSNGGDLFLKTGLTTGTGSSKMVFSVSDNTFASSDTTIGTYTDRLIIAPPKKISVAKSTAVQNPLFIIDVPVNTTAQGSFDLGISINNTSNFQSQQDHYMYSIINKGGVLSTNFSNFGAVTTQTSGSLNVTMSLVNGTNQVIIRPTINVGNISGTLTDSYAYMTIRNTSSSSITLYT